MLRSPIQWLSDIKTPTFVFEGSEQPSNIGAVGKLQQSTQNPAVRFYTATGYDHFSILAAVTPFVAKQILADTSMAPNFKFGGRLLIEIM